MPHADEMFHKILTGHLAKTWQKVEVLDGALCVDQFFIAWIDGQELDFGGGGMTNDNWSDTKLNAGDPLFFDKLDKCVEGMLGTLCRKPNA